MIDGSDVLGIVLAGGEGKRLMPLTTDRAKPAVPFGGVHRLIDFVLSNLVHGGIRRICVLTQYKSHSLDRHISTTWRLSSLTGEYVTPVPAQQRLGPRWFQGSADAIHQSLNLVHDESPAYIAVFGADNIYRMDPRQMIDAHIASGAGVTVAGIRVPRAEARSFGVISTEDGTKIDAFLEKPEDPPGLPDSPDESYVSMGNYVFTTQVMLDALHADAKNPASKHDMGRDIIPALVEKSEAAVYDFNGNVVPGETDRDHGYWRDVGTIDSYYDAHTDLISTQPIFNLYNRKWPILAHPGQRAAAKFVEGGTATQSIVSNGCIISGAQVVDSVLSPDVFVENGAVVQGSVLLDGARVGRGAVVRRAILDKNVVVPPGAHIGVDLSRDRGHYHVSDFGIVVLGKGETAI
ncbi:glucose-1-phosphate adenylyltransferase [Amycolatopsis echigonensis]|uniref:Glucose-1-phosphate adenylyltransferase n=1 Tax=Amycolatopsis echigonensis TaxID=2576905 RepID=A0A8E2B8H2_9PSEU|nr:glucose-1-phosphate adenylyltransferase [Amycolatopsis echigonensis]MBB2505021.1 glucose-1-phosphate adenylyltransferase [Amycolatopsis echigonensis]